MIYKNGFHNIDCDLNKVIIFNNVEIAYPKRLKLGYLKTMYQKKLKREPKLKKVVILFSPIK